MRTSEPYLGFGHLGQIFPPHHRPVAFTRRVDRQLHLMVPSYHYFIVAGRGSDEAYLRGNGARCRQMIASHHIDLMKRCTIMGEYNVHLPLFPLLCTVVWH